MPLKKFVAQDISFVRRRAALRVHPECHPDYDLFFSSTYKNSSGC